ncbi:hypothetical protein LX32DRAFT_117540 [Colletotrichum zoysiae]|uniref:Secreted protein n=1 Tax=Colletotrichum zoysiae TaxID=1216348 RepID=A0AAD9HRY0_9PEZI|nr:hypothetical protein LX32DRAFT_117540 [Colletotrichum zoysiae]
MKKHTHDASECFLSVCLCCGHLLFVASSSAHLSTCRGVRLLLIDGWQRSRPIRYCGWSREESFVFGEKVDVVGERERLPYLPTTQVPR